ncbi:hypothetical protein GXC69_12395 [Candidatus Macondimonas diazotrophica]|nr:hypothetical protein [Candidatus Macondimonas diazotrophica]
MASRVVIPFFTDHNVPDSVGRVILESNHGLTRLRDVMDTETADPVIAVACARSGHVLVTKDSDFKAISARLKITQRQYRSSLHRIYLACDPPRARNRMIDALSLIEHEWGLIQPDRPMTIQITNTTIRTER